MKDEIRQILAILMKDAYSAEKQATRVMQKAAREASAPELRDAIQVHIEETQTQIERLETIMEMMEVRPGRYVCEAMRGLAEEAGHDISAQEQGPLRDLAIVASIQRIEHYEIASYGTNIALADAIGEPKVVELLSQTLAEEKTTDAKMTDLTKSAILSKALAG